MNVYAKRPLNACDSPNSVRINRWPQNKIIVKKLKFLKYWKFLNSVIKFTTIYKYNNKALQICKKAQDKSSLTRHKARNDRLLYEIVWLMLIHGQKMYNH